MAERATDQRSCPPGVFESFIISKEAFLFQVEYMTNDHCCVCDQSKAEEEINLKARL